MVEVVLIEEYVVPLHEDFEAGRPQLCGFPTQTKQKQKQLMIVNLELCFDCLASRQ